ncbi:MAG: hypothetical protein L0312_16275 [Acidobacteria bacterium]|nr:hypothetical protein [Acidobacteriota bacterium]
MKQKHPFDELREVTREQQEAFYAAQYEASRVRYMLKVLHLSKQETTLRTDWEKQTGSANLTFAAFNEQYPSFPVVLGASLLDGCKLHTDPRAFIPSLFKDFQRAPFVTAYDEFYESNRDRADGRALGLVFRRKGILHGMVIHSEGMEGVWHRGLVWVYHGGTRTTPFRLYVRPFQVMLEGIWSQGRGWRP